MLQCAPPWKVPFCTQHASEQSRLRRRQLTQHVVDRPWVRGVDLLQSRASARRVGLPMKEPLLRRPSTATNRLREDSEGLWNFWRSRFGKIAVGIFFVTINASAPIILDWVKRSHGGRFLFSVPAMTFHAYAIGALLGFATSLRHRHWRLTGWHLLPKYFVPASLFCGGDILSMTSMQHIDPGLFSLVGKALSVVFTVLVSRMVFGPRLFTRTQYYLAALLAFSTCAFSHAEVNARVLITGASSDSLWWFTTMGLAQRVAGVACNATGSVMQERLLASERGTPFLLQQRWIGCCGMVTSLFALRCVHGLPLSHLAVGFSNTPAMVLLATYSLSGIMAGLIVKHLGAVAKVLFTPLYLGIVYFYAVSTGSAALTVPVVASWSTSALCILLYSLPTFQLKRRQRQDIVDAENEATTSRGEDRSA